jgi:hypothetical protein
MGVTLACPHNPESSKHGTAVEKEEEEENGRSKENKGH